MHFFFSITRREHVLFYIFRSNEYNFFFDKLVFLGKILILYFTCYCCFTLKRIELLKLFNQNIFFYFQKTVIKYFFGRPVILFIFSELAQRTTFLRFFLAVSHVNSDFKNCDRRNYIPFIINSDTIVFFFEILISKIFLILFMNETF